ncbi:hypothetical protein EOW77_0028150 [Bradyrhizobium yuanmingense]|uniref:hypothetical protein n=1 Tax=Bradyrhizobium yuanmingense TaxID=108015 RepID=UPI000FE42DDF|nr:hypothetical protein [Bradyrhizobium yuanmingense]TGN80498.1 hypothetical protein EOW77_0028150 [Bradyrhizobium yuanmingense]
MNRSQLIPALHKAGDTATLHSINAWAELTGKPLIADNDNHAEPARPINKSTVPDGTVVETLMETTSAEELIAMYEEDQKAKKDPTFEKKLPPYSLGQHVERFRRPRKAKASPAQVNTQTVEDVMVRGVDESRFRTKMGKHADVLDAVLDDSTAAEIGQLIAGPGSSKRTCEGIGKQAVVRAARKLAELMAA